MPGKHALIRTRHAHANLCTTYLHLNSDTCTWTHSQTHSHTAGDQESGSNGRVDQRRRWRQYVRSVSLWYSLSFAWKLCHAVRQQLGREVTDSMCVCDLNRTAVSSVLIWPVQQTHSSEFTIQLRHCTQVGLVPRLTYLYYEREETLSLTLKS